MCKDWHALITQDDCLVQIITTHKKEHASRKHKVATLTPDPLPRPPMRLALSSIGINLQRPPIHPPSSHITSSLPPSIKLRLCPNCTSPAKELNLRRAECTVCLFDFCKKCTRRYHEGGCKTMQELSGEEEVGPSSIHIAGKLKSKAVKKRLRRL